MTNHDGMWAPPTEDPRTTGTPIGEPETIRDPLVAAVHDEPARPAPAPGPGRAHLVPPGPAGPPRGAPPLLDHRPRWLDTEPGLGTLITLPQDDRATVRDILIHLIEEYARHRGHADLLHECIDGRTGQ